MSDVIRLSQALTRASNPRVRHFGYDTLGHIYTSQSEYELALDHLVTAYDIVLGTDDYKTTARRVSLSLQIGTLHVKLKNFTAAYDLISNATTLALKQNITMELAPLYLTLIRPSGHFFEYYINA